MYGSSSFVGPQLNLRTSGGTAAGAGLPFDPTQFLQMAMQERGAKSKLEREGMRLQNRGMAGDIREQERARRGTRTTAGRPQVAETRQPIYGVQGLGGVLSPYIPGKTPLGPGQTPVVMGYMPEGSGPPTAPGTTQAVSPESMGLGASGASLSGAAPAGEGGSGASGGSGGGGGGGGSEERADWNKTGTTNLADQQKAGQAVGQRMGTELDAANTAKALNLGPEMIPWLMTPDGQRAASMALMQGLKINPNAGSSKLGGDDIGGTRPAGTPSVGPVRGAGAYQIPGVPRMSW